MKVKDKDLQHLAAIVRDSDDAIIGKTLEGIITSWNGGAERIYGYTAEEAIGRTVAMLVPPDREDELPKILQKLTQGESISHYDTLRVTKEGRVVNISLTISPIRDTPGSGVITGASSIGRDVTKEKEAEAALRESAAAYKLLMEQASDAILVSYPDQPIIEVNQRASDMLGYTREELLQLRGQGQGSALPEGLSTFPLQADEVLAGDIVYSERPVRRKDGTIIVTELSTRRLDDGRILTIARDITERKREEEALRKSEIRYRTVVEDQTEVISRFLPDGTLTFVNEASCQHWGLTREELIGSTFFRFLPDEERKNMERHLSSLDRDNYVSANEQRMVYPDGRIRWLNWATSALFDDQGNFIEFQSVGVDITERKQTENDLREITERLNEAQHLALLGSWEWDVRDNTVTWSEGLYRIFGVKPQQFGATFEAYMGYVYPDDRERVGKDIERALREKGSFAHECRFVKPDGTVRHNQARGETVLDEAGNTVKMRGTAQDITERKQSEMALATSEAELRALFAAMTDVVLVLDAQGRYLQIAPTSPELLYRPPAELLGRTIHEVLPTADADKILHCIELALETQDSVHVEYSLPIGEGEVWFDGMVSPMGEDKVFWIARDITERKEAEEAVTFERYLLNSLMDSTPDSIYFKDMEGKFTRINQALAESVGLTNPAEAVGMSDADFFSEELARSSLNDEQEIISTGRPILAKEEREVWPDGHETWVLTTKMPLHDAQGNITGTFGVSREITESKGIEASLRESEQRYKQMFEGNGSVQWLIDPTTGSIVEANQAASDFYGYSLEELKGMNIIDINKGLDEARAKPLLERMSREAVTLVSRHTLASGEVRDIEARAGPIDIGGRRLIHSIITDITEQKRAEGARIAQEAAERANHAKSEFLSRMSHELRTPLNAILGFGQLLQMDSTTPEQEESVEYIIKAGEHLLNLINEVLDIARIEEGKLAISIEPVFVREVLQESLDLVQPLASRRNIVLNVDLAWMDNCYVMADRQRLQQVLLNLFTNAIKYNHEGGVVGVSCSELSHEIGGAQPKDQGREGRQDPQSLDRVRIAVSDSGHGLSADKLARLFTPFERLGAEHGDVEGTGLGLAISRHLVEAMGGVIGVESEQGIGSTFWVDLSPADEQMPALEYMGTGPLFHSVVREQVRTMLYIEDNLSNLRLIERILRQWPEIHLITAMQGQMGLDLAYEHRPDLILLDLHLPDMPGNEVLARLQEDPRTASIPVVILSADANPLRVNKLLEAGARAYLTKPFDVKQLLKVLEETAVQLVG